MKDPDRFPLRRGRGKGQHLRTWPGSGAKVMGGLVASVMALGLAACGSDEQDGGSSTSTRTVDVAIAPAMPYVGLEGGEMTGIDGDLLNEAAKRSSIEVKPVSVDFAGLLAGVQSNRYDIGIGNIAWTEERAAAGAFTDPPYYGVQMTAHRPGIEGATLDDLEGLQLATVQGFYVVPALTEIPNAELKTYQTFDAVLQDLSAGRTDVAFLDPLTVAFAKQKKPDLNFETTPLEPPTPEQLKAHPEYGAFLPYMTGWYMAPQQEALAADLNEAIRGMYQDGTAAKIIEKWGGDSELLLTPPSPDFGEQRHKVDRDRSWSPPSL